MNSIEFLKQELSHIYADAVLTLTAPLNASGVWFLDVGINGKKAVIQWSDGNTFGITDITNNDHGYGEAAQFETKGFLSALQQITQILD